MRTFMRAGFGAARFVTLSAVTALAACATGVDPPARSAVGDASAGTGPFGGTSGASGAGGSGASSGQGGSAAFGAGAFGGTFGAGGSGGSTDASGGTGASSGTGTGGSTGAGTGGSAGTAGSVTTGGSAGSSGSGGSADGSSGTGMGGVGGVPTGCDCSRTWVANQQIDPPLSLGQCIGYMGGMYEYSPENLTDKLNYGHASCPPGDWSMGDCRWYAKLIYRGPCP